jgi:hypothetical protein
MYIIMRSTNYSRKKRVSRKSLRKNRKSLRGGRKSLRGGRKSLRGGRKSLKGGSIVTYAFDQHNLSSGPPDNSSSGPPVNSSSVGNACEKLKKMDSANDHEQWCLGSNPAQDKLQYKKLARLFHPDKNLNCTEVAERLFKKLQTRCNPPDVVTTAFTEKYHQQVIDSWKDILEWRHKAVYWHSRSNYANEGDPTGDEFAKVCLQIANEWNKMDKSYIIWKLKNDELETLEDVSKSGTPLHNLLTTNDAPIKLYANIPLIAEIPEESEFSFEKINQKLSDDQQIIFKMGLWPSYEKPFEKSRKSTPTKTDRDEFTKLQEGGEMAISTSALPYNLRYIDDLPPDVVVTCDDFHSGKYDSLGKLAEAGVYINDSEDVEGLNLANVANYLQDNPAGISLINKNNIGEIHGTKEHIDALSKTLQKEIQNKHMIQTYYMVETNYTAINYLCKALRQVHNNMSVTPNFSTLRLPTSFKEPSTMIEPILSMHPTDDPANNVSKALLILDKLKHESTDSESKIFVKYYVKPTYDAKTEE